MHGPGEPVVVEFIVVPLIVLLHSIAMAFAHRSFPGACAQALPRNKVYMIIRNTTMCHVAGLFLGVWGLIILSVGSLGMLSDTPAEWTLGNWIEGMLISAFAIGSPGAGYTDHRLR